MADASESPQTQPEPAPEAPSARKGTGKKGQGQPAASPAIMARVRLTNDLDASLRNHEAEVAQALDELLSPFVEDGERLELPTLLRAVRRLVTDRQTRLDRTDFEHDQELTVDKERQREKRRRFQELRRLMVDLRQVVNSMFGRAAVKQFLGLEKPTGREPVLLLRQAQRVLEHLRDPERPRPEPKHEGGSLKWDRWIEKLETPTRELERALEEQRTEAGVSEGSLRQKHLDLELYDRQVHAAARWIVATFELADRKSYGRSLLPFTKSRLRRSGTGTVEEPASEPSVGATGDETEVSPTPPSASAERESKDG